MTVLCQNFVPFTQAVVYFMLLCYFAAIVIVVIIIINNNIINIIYTNVLVDCKLIVNMSEA